MTSQPDTNWRVRFDNGVALKIGKAGRSEGIINVRREIKSFIEQVEQNARREERENLYRKLLLWDKKEILRTDEKEYTGYQVSVWIFKGDVLNLLQSLQPEKGRTTTTVGKMK